MKDERLNNTMSEDEMLYRERYLAKDGETAEQRAVRKASVRKLLKDTRDLTVGVNDKGLLKSFDEGKGGKR